MEKKLCKKTMEKNYGKKISKQLYVNRTYFFHIFLLFFY